MTWMDGDQTSILDKTYVVAGEYVTDSAKLPSKDDSQLDADQTYRFTGKWTTEGGQLASALRATRNYTFYPEIVQSNVHDFATDGKFFNITSNGVLSPNVPLTGKITIPNTVNGIQVKTISGFTCTPVATTILEGNVGAYDCDGKGAKVTGIYFLPGNTVTKIDDNAFENCYRLVTFEWPSNLETIGVSAFASCYSLESSDLTNASKLTTIYQTAFRNTWYTCVYSGNPVSSILLPASVTAYGVAAMYYMGAFGDETRRGFYRLKYNTELSYGQSGHDTIPYLRLGDSGNPVKLASNGVSAQTFDGYDNIEIYYDNSAPDAVNKYNDLVNAFSNYTASVIEAY